MFNKVWHTGQHAAGTAGQEAASNAQASINYFHLYDWEPPAGNWALYYATHKRAFLTKVKSTDYVDLDAKARLRILAEVSS